MFAVDALNELLGRDTFFFRTQHNRCAVCVIRANVMTGMPAHFLEAHPNVGLDVFHQVAEVNAAIGVGQGGGNQDGARHDESRGGKGRILAALLGTRT